MSAGTGASAGFGPATTAPVSGASIVMAFGTSAPLANPLAATSTPATRVKPGASWFATGSVSTNVPLGSRTNVCFADGSIRPSSNGKKWTPVGAGAPAGAVSVTTTFGPSPRAAASQPGAAAGSASRVAAIALPHCG